MCCTIALCVSRDHLIIVIINNKLIYNVLPIGFWNLFYHFRNVKMRHDLRSNGVVMKIPTDLN